MHKVKTKYKTFKFVTNLIEVTFFLLKSLLFKTFNQGKFPFTPTKT